MIKFLKILIIPILFINQSLVHAKADKTKELLPKIVQNYLKTNFLNATFAFSKGEEIFVQGAEGVRDDAGNRLTANEVMQIASNSKSITAAAILRLQDKKLLNVSDPIIKHLGSKNSIWPSNKAPKWAETITIHNLLTHTSGIVEYFGVNLFNAKMSHQEINKKIVEYAVNTPLLIVPGTEYKYSSTNYVLLGLIIEKLSGKPLADFFKKEFFDPLEMNNTYLIPLADVIKLQQDPKDIKFPNNYIVSLVKNQKTREFKRVKLPTLIVPYADGGIASNTVDMIKWYNALTHNKVISAEAYKLMTTKHYELQKALLGNKTYTGYGIYISDLSNNNQLIHGSGSIPGVRSEVGYIPSKDIYYAVISNVSTHNLGKKKIEKNIHNKIGKLDIKFFLNYIFKGLKIIR